MEHMILHSHVKGDTKSILMERERKKERPKHNVYYSIIQDLSFNMHIQEALNSQGHVTLQLM